MRKHGVTFDEAASAFRDARGLWIEDPDHSDTEERWILLGISENLRLLTVVHTELTDNDIRIISARRANRKESRQYRDRGG